MASLLPKSLAALEVYPDHLSRKEHTAKRKELNAEKFKQAGMHGAGASSQTALSLQFMPSGCEQFQG